MSWSLGQSPSVEGFRFGRLFVFVGLPRFVNEGFVTVRFGLRGFEDQYQSSETYTFPLVRDSSDWLTPVPYSRLPPSVTTHFHGP